MINKKRIAYTLLLIGVIAFLGYSLKIIYDPLVKIIGFVGVFTGAFLLSSTIPSRKPEDPSRKL